MSSLKAIGGSEDNLCVEFECFSNFEVGCFDVAVFPIDLNPVWRRHTFIIRSHLQHHQTLELFYRDN